MGTRRDLPTSVGFLVFAVAVPISAPVGARAAEHEADCALPFTAIHEIQGAGDASPSLGATVTTQGVVVGDFEGPTSVGLQGFYLQDPIGDNDPDTSEGLFIFDGNTDNGVAVGDIVRVTGRVSEFGNQTQLSGSIVVDCALNASVAPVDVRLPSANVTGMESLEGMLVRLPQELTIAEYFNYDRFGEIVLARPLEAAAGRPMTPTSVVEPGAPARARLRANQLRRITLDDGLAVQNPSSLRHPNGAAFSLTNRFRGGDTVINVTGVLSGSFGYRVEPTAPADYFATNPRPVAPEPVGGRLRVSAFNMLNYFLTLDPSGGPSDNACGPTQSEECRGADTTEELARQRAKLLAALVGVDADVVGVNEIENTPGVEPLADVAAGLNGMLGAGAYEYIDTNVIGPDVIRVGLLYRPAAVTPVGDWEILTSQDDPRFDESLNRPALAQTFEENATGERFTVVVNHLKSKNADPACMPDAGDGQGACNEVRLAAARALVDWVAGDPTGSADPDVLITGDLNAYAREDPIDAVLAGADDERDTADDYTNLVRRFAGRFAYSYVFDGMSGYLDHALSSAALTRQVTGATIWHINADEPDVLDYDMSFKPSSVDAIYAPDAYRSSDHDPVVVGVNLGAGD